MTFVYHINQLKFFINQTLKIHRFLISKAKIKEILRPTPYIRLLVEN
jgi:hypothetical protein